MLSQHPSSLLFPLGPHGKQVGRRVGGQHSWDSRPKWTKVICHTVSIMLSKKSWGRRRRGGPMFRDWQDIGLPVQSPMFHFLYSLPLLIRLYLTPQALSLLFFLCSPSILLEERNEQAAHHGPFWCPARDLRGSRQGEIWLNGISSFSSGTEVASLAQLLFRFLGIPAQGLSYQCRPWIWLCLFLRVINQQGIWHRNLLTQKTGDKEGKTIWTLSWIRLGWS